VSGVVMQAFPQIEYFNKNKAIFNSFPNEQKKEIVYSCPTNVYKMTNNNLVDIENLMNCTFCQECVIKANSFKTSTRAMKIEPDYRQFLFKVETVGSMKPEQVVLYGINILKNKFLEISKEVEDKYNISSNR
jgi:ferredoxin-like protein FixX